MLNFNAASKDSSKENSEPLTPSLAQSVFKAASLPLLAIASPFFLSSCKEAPPMAPRATLPQQFTVQGKFISIGTDMTFSDAKGPFASIEQRTLNLNKTFEYFDSGHNLSAKAKQQFFTLGAKIDITDSSGKAIGTVEENVLKSLFKVKTSYLIKDASGKSVGQSEKLDWTGTTVTFQDTSGKHLAKMERPMWDMGGATWTVNVEPNLPFDSRLILFVPAFKTAADSARSAASSSSKTSSRK